MKKQISFYLEKISDLYLMKIQISFYSEKIPDLYLIKIQTSFLFRKNFRSIFPFFISIFNVNTNQFCIHKKF